MSHASLKRPIRFALALFVGLAAGGAALAAVDAAKVEHDRHENFHKIGAAFKVVNDQLKADKPDAGAIGAQARVIHGLAPQIPSWFPAGSGPESGVKTRAKAEIWTDKAGFAAAAKGLETESAKLETIARAGDMDAIKAQVKATGEACGTCHKKFRGPELDHDHEH
jgi:cytochrome c556